MIAQRSRWSCALLFAVLFTACTPSPLAITVDKKIALTGSAIFPADLKLASDGALHIAYLGSGEVRQLRFQPPVGASEVVYSLENPAQSGFSFSLALNTLGQAGIAYFDEDHDDLIYSERHAGRWVAERVDEIGAVGYFVSLAYDRQDQPHISYFDHTHNDVKYATRTEHGWRTETIDTYGLPGFHIPAGFTQLALRCSPSPENCSAMQPVVFYLAYRYKPYDGELRAAYRDSQGWRIETVDADRGAGGYLSLALDTQGQPWVSYYRASTWDFAYGELRLAHQSGGRWQVEVVDAGEYVGRGSALALTAGDKPVIAYYAAAPSELRLAVQNGGWQLGRLTDGAAVNSWTALVRNKQNAWYVAYADPDAGVTNYLQFTLRE